MFLIRVASQKTWVAEAEPTSCFYVARLNVSNSVTAFSCWQVFFWTGCIVRQLVQEIQILLSDIGLKRFVCTPPATVAVPIYCYFLSCGDFPTLQHCAQNRTTSNSFCLSSFGLVHCSLEFPFQFRSQKEGAGEILLPQEISISSGTVHLTSVTSLWMVSVMPTI